MKKLLLSLIIIAPLCLVNMAHATSAPTPTSDDDVISSLTVVPHSTELAATTNYTYEFVTTSTLDSGDTIYVLFNDVQNTLNPTEIGFDFSAGTISSATLTTATFASHDSYIGVGIITLNSQAEAGTYGFTLSNVINPATSVDAFPGLSTDTWSSQMHQAYASQVSFAAAADESTTPYMEQDPTSAGIYETAINSVTGLVDGQITIAYNNPEAEGEVIEINFEIFKNDSSEEIVQYHQYPNTAYGLFLNGNKNQVALVNLLSGEVLSTKTIGSSVFAASYFDIYKLQGDYYTFSLLKRINKKNTKVRAVLVKINIGNEKLTKKSVINISGGKNIQVSKTKKSKKNKNTILIKNKKGKILHNCFLSKNGNFKNKE